ncbi:MAG: hypothetical protein ACI8PZ_006807 [Myxococcota bacterium]|jgi:hypothetical protein
MSRMFLLLLAACVSSALEDKADDAAAPVIAEVCTDGIDNDEDGLKDCVDPDCDGQCAEDCQDGRDNDGDGALDCADTDCFGLCPELCDDGLDNDADGNIDCADPDCFGECPEICGDGLDNDGDGLADCADDACDGECPEACTDERDNDGDGAVDCDDPDCDGMGCVEVCDDGRDNDGDGAADCADPECIDPIACPEQCDDGVDNDGDLDVDCDDLDCDGFCPERCNDGRDNDGDELIDLDDPDCDADGDGVPPLDKGGLDCDDGDPTVYPGADDPCGDGIDQDCDGRDNCGIHNTLPWTFDAINSAPADCSFPIGQNAYEFLDLGAMPWRDCAIEASMRGAMHAGDDSYSAGNGWFGWRDGAVGMIEGWPSVLTAALGSDQRCVVGRDPFADRRTDALAIPVEYDGLTWLTADLGDRFYDECATAAGNAGATMIPPAALGLPQSGDYWIKSVHGCNVYAAMNPGGSIVHNNYGYGARSSSQGCFIGYVE